MLAVQEKLATPQEFQQWVNQNNGILCRITPQQRPETPSNNEALLGQLTNKLAERSLVSLFLTFHLWSKHNADLFRSTL
jgi:hypothetical protein